MIFAEVITLAGESARLGARSAEDTPAQSPFGVSKDRFPSKFWSCPPDCLTGGCEFESRPPRFWKPSCLRRVFCWGGSGRNLRKAHDLAHVFGGGEGRRNRLSGRGLGMGRDTALSSSPKRVRLLAGWWGWKTTQLN